MTDTQANKILDIINRCIKEINESPDKALNNLVQTIKVIEGFCIAITVSTSETPEGGDAL